MKRICTLLLCVLLFLPLTASASGLGGRGRPSFEGTSGDAGVLPDPADLTGSEGTVYAKNYNFSSDFICTVYTYPLPDAGFLDAYLNQAKANGFKTTETEVEGYAAWRLESGGLAALLLPQYGNVMMLMVQNGMTFGDPLPEYYMRMVYNGREMMVDSKGLDLMRSYDAYQYKFDCFAFDQVPGHVSIRFPKFMQAGEEYTWTPSNPPEYMYLYIDGSLLLDYQSFTRSGEWGGKNDYFHLKIVSKNETAQGLVIEGRFDGILDYASVKIENGAFRILIR